MAVVALGRIASVFNRVKLEREQKKNNVFNEAARMKTLPAQA